MICRRWLPLLTLLLVLTSCATPKDSAEGEREVAPRATRNRSTAGGGPSLAPDNGEVHTIQLYSGDDERRVPIAGLDTAEPLTLEFDVLNPTGRPLSVYFYHFDREWNQDLMTGEYMAGFQRDDILDFRSSFGDTRYTHYRYTFPNAAISFRRSGNFILRVTEQGREDQVLFERPFFLSEQSTPVQMDTESIPLSGFGFPGTAPSIRFDPGTDAGTPNDYRVCFVRNGKLERMRCAPRPSLMSQPTLHFYLDSENAFAPETADYYLDLTSYRPGGRVESANLVQVPYQVTLDPDYAKFPATSADPNLNGQVVTSRVPGDSDHGGEYAQVRFSLVPPGETRYSGTVRLIGSFNGWQTRDAVAMTWNAESSRYEGTVLIKQGEYEYRYLATDGRLSDALAEAPPRIDNFYTAFVYYRDIRVGTDRLLAVSVSRTR